MYHFAWELQTCVLSRHDKNSKVLGLTKRQGLGRCAFNFTVCCVLPAASRCTWASWSLQLDNPPKTSFNATSCLAVSSVTSVTSSGQRDFKIRSKSREVEVAFEATSLSQHCYNGSGPQFQWQACSPLALKSFSSSCGLTSFASNTCNQVRWKNLCNTVGSIHSSPHSRGTCVSSAPL